MSISAYVVDYADEREVRHEGSSEISRVVNVAVNGTDSRDAAIREASWATDQDAEGDILSTRLVEVQGVEQGYDPGSWLISHEVTFIRYW